MATTATATKNNVPNWRVSGDWFDVCKCNIPCPCIFAQAPSYEDCEAVFAYHVKLIQWDLNGKEKEGQASISHLNGAVLKSSTGIRRSIHFITG